MTLATTRVTGGNPCYNRALPELQPAATRAMIVLAKAATKGNRGTTSDYRAMTVLAKAANGHGGAATSHRVCYNRFRRLINGDLTTKKDAKIGTTGCYNGPPGLLQLCLTNL